MEKNNICLGCKFSTIKLIIPVPENYKIQEFVETIQCFYSDIIELSRIESIHHSLPDYSLRKRSMEHSKAFKFKINCSCNLKAKKSNDCSNFKLREKKDCKISHLLYSKPSTSEKMEIELTEGF